MKVKLYILIVSPKANLFKSFKCYIPLKTEDLENDMKYDEFKEMCHKAWDERYNYLCIDMTKNIFHPKLYDTFL